MSKKLLASRSTNGDSQQLSKTVTTTLGLIRTATAMQIRNAAAFNELYHRFLSMCINLQLAFYIYR